MQFPLSALGQPQHIYCSARFRLESPSVLAAAGPRGRSNGPRRWCRWPKHRNPVLALANRGLHGSPRSMTSAWLTAISNHPEDSWTQQDNSRCEPCWDYDEAVALAEAGSLDSVLVLERLQITPGWS